MTLFIPSMVSSSGTHHQFIGYDRVFDPNRGHFASHPFPLHPNETNLYPGSEFHPFMPPPYPMIYSPPNQPSNQLIPSSNSITNPSPNPNTNESSLVSTKYATNKHRNNNPQRIKPSPSTSFSSSPGTTIPGPKSVTIGSTGPNGSNGHNNTATTQLDVHQEKPIRLKVKVRVPVDDHPSFNFVGKLLGPKGQSLKWLQQETQTKMAIYGKGSFRDRHKEDELRKEDDPKYGHLREDLHVEITAVAPAPDAYSRIGHALHEVKRFLVPDYYDDIRQKQLKELGILIPDPRGSIKSSCGSVSADEIPMETSSSPSSSTSHHKIMQNQGKHPAPSSSNCLHSPPSQSQSQSPSSSSSVSSSNFHTPSGTNVTLTSGCGLNAAGGMHPEATSCCSCGIRKIPCSASPPSPSPPSSCSQHRTGPFKRKMAAACSLHRHIPYPPIGR